MEPVNQGKKPVMGTNVMEPDDQPQQTAVKNTELDLIKLPQYTTRTNNAIEPMYHLQQTVVTNTQMNPLQEVQQSEIAASKMYTIEQTQQTVLTITEIDPVLQKQEHAEKNTKIDRVQQHQQTEVKTTKNENVQQGKHDSVTTKESVLLEYPKQNDVSTNEIGLVQQQQTIVTTTKMDAEQQPQQTLITTSKTVEQPPHAIVETSELVLLEESLHNVMTINSLEIVQEKQSKKITATKMLNEENNSDRNSSVEIQTTCVDASVRDLQLLPLAACTSEQSRHARLFLVITGILTEIMQELMEFSKFPPQELYNKICADKHFYKKLSTKDWQVVKTLQDPSKRYKSLDISLMYMIVKYFKTFITSPTRNWGSNPQKHEVDIGDDVERIRRARNDYLHEISTKVTEQTLTEFFDVFIDVGKRIDFYMKIPTESSFESKLRNFKTCCIDERIINKALETSSVVESKAAWIVIPVEGKLNTVHVYRMKGLTEYIEERKKLPEAEKTPLLCIFPDIKDDDYAQEKARILNEYSDQINEGLISIKFVKATVGCIILSLEIENKILHHDPTFEQQLKMLIINVMKYMKMDSVYIVNTIVTMTEGWHSIDDGTESCTSEDFKEGNTLVLNFEVDNSILQTADVFQQNIKHLFEVISTITNDEYVNESDNVLAIISPIQKGIVKTPLPVANETTKMREIRLPTPLTEEDSNFLRFYYLVKTLGAQAVRCQFDNVFPPAELSAIIKRNMGVFIELKNSKHLNAQQWGLIRTLGSTATSSDFDVSLMILFFRHMSSVAPEGFDYDKLPEPNDTRICADLARIKYYRNYIAHCSDDKGKRNSNTFRLWWETVSQAVIRIGGEKYTRMCSDLLDCSLDASYMRLNERENIARMLNHWRDEDKCFVDTAASKAISEIMKTENVVIVTGSPGSGKSFTAKHILISMKDEGYDIIPVTTLSDMAKFISINTPHVFFIDNFCGKYNISVHEIEYWERNDEIKKLMEANIIYNKNQNCEQTEKTKLQPNLNSSLHKIILTCRLQIFNDPMFKNLHLESCKICDLSGHHKISTSERVLICKQYLSDDVINSLDNDIINKYDCFPLLCSLFNSRENEDTLFFRHPKTYFKKELDELKIKQDKIKYACIALCVMFNDNVPFEIFKSRNNHRTKQIFEKIFEECEVNLSTPGKTVKTQFDTMVGSFFSKTETGYKSIHDYMFDIYCNHVCSEMLSCIVEYADSGLMRDRAFLQSIGQMDMYGQVVVPKDLELKFFQRIRQDIMNCKIKDVFAASQMKHELYRSELIKVLSNVELNTTQDTYGNTPLLILSITGYSEVLESLIKKGGDVNMCNRSGKSPLYIASYKGHTECVNLLLKNGAEVNLSDVNGESPLYAASSNGYNDCVDILLKQGAEVNKCNDKNISPLHATILKMVCNSGVDFDESLLFKSSYDDCLDLLLKNGAAVNQYANFKTSPIITTLFLGNMEILQKMSKNADNSFCFLDTIFQSLKMSNGLNDVYDVLLKQGIGFNVVYEDCLSKLVATKDNTYILHILNRLCKCGADVNFCNKFGTSPLHVASILGQNDCVNFFLNKGAEVNHCDVNGASPLFTASIVGKADILEILCNRGANVNLCMNGISPLGAASTQGHKDCVYVLLKNGADVNICDINGKSALFAASFEGNADIVEMLCNRGAHVNLCRKDGISPLFIAVLQGHKDCVYVLLNKGGEVNLCDVNRASPLFEASDQGKTDILEMLCNMGADVNLCNKNGESPLLRASFQGHEDCVQVLIDNGADVNLCDVNRYSPLFAASVEGRTDIVGMLCTRGADVNLCTKDGISPLGIASLRGHKDCVHMLLNNGAEVDLCTGGNSPLFVASSKGFTDILEELCDRGANVNLCLQNGTSPLFIASFEGHADCVNVLLNKGADVNLCTKDGISPLVIASFKGYKECVHVLLDKGAKVDLGTVDGKPPLFVASSEGFTDIVADLCNKGADVNLCLEDGTSPLFIASGEGHIDCVNLLLNNGAVANPCNMNGRSPLFAAIYKGHLDILEELCNKGADVNWCDTTGISPLFIALFQGHTDCVNILLDKGAEVNLCFNGASPLLFASGEGKTDIVQTLCNRGADVNLCDKDGMSPLLKSSYLGHKDCVNVLLNKGAEVNLCANNEVSPLFVASFEGKTDIVETLCNRGAYVNLCRKDGASPLYIASFKGHNDCVNVLIKNGAEINLCNEKGESALFAASSEGHKDCVNVLIKNGAEINKCNERGESALFAASSGGKTDILKMLCNNGAVVNLCRNDGVSPLLIAAYNKHVYCVIVLLRYVTDWKLLSWLFV